MFNPLSISFGPAHPAAHGVFRMIVELDCEIILRSYNLQGLLWRFTEEIAEYRNPELVNGYFARLDYVSYVNQEIAYSVFSHLPSSSIVTSFLHISNISANHLLNLSCTLADSGMVGAIL